MSDDRGCRLPWIDSISHTRGALAKFQVAIQQPQRSPPTTAIIALCSHRPCTLDVVVVAAAAANFQAQIVLLSPPPACCLTPPRPVARP